MKAINARKALHIFLAYLLVAPVFSPLGSAFGQDNLITGCAPAVSSPDYGNGFVSSDFDLSGVELDGDGRMFLDTAQRELDPNFIEIPVDQQVAVTFLFEGAGFNKTDFGWMYADDTLANGDPDFNKVRWIYENVKDNNNDGVLDNENQDWNGDGVKNVKDNRRLLADNGEPVTFNGGDEIVFVLDSSDNGGSGGVFYSKTAWNETFTKCNANGGFSKIYQFFDDIGGSDGDGKCYDYDADCYDKKSDCHEQGWMDQDAIDRVFTHYGYSFREPNNKDPEGFNERAVSVLKGDLLPHFLLAAPDESPDAWILGVEDLKGGGDLDYNDITFLIERQTGGVAELKPDNAITTGDENSFFTKVELEVYDSMPCNGSSQVQYFLSVDYETDENGDYVLDEDENKIPAWKEVKTTDWTEVKSFTRNNGNPNLSNGYPSPDEENIIDSWKPGAPDFTYRRAVIDLISENRIGREILWKAEFESENEECIPRVYDVKVNATVAKNATFSRSAPIIQTNVLYSGSYETPNPLDTQWMKEPVLRGHLKAFQIYDPVTFTTFANEDGSYIWNAGEELADRTSGRYIYYPNMTVTKNSEEIAMGDGETTTFSGTLANYPVLDGTLAISAQTNRLETFEDLYSDDILKTDVIGASGNINRFDGTFTVTFAEPPMEEEPVMAHYSSYALSGGDLLDFDGTQVDADLLNITAEDSATVGAVQNWAQGLYPDGTARPWPLGAIDHSAPAVMTPPGLPEWYFGSDTPDSLKNSYYEEGNSNSFRLANEERSTVVFVGSRSGMLHAFDGGEFRWGDNPETDEKENRGYFEWDGSTKETADYGTGEELWAYIPGNLVPKLKNNYDLGSVGSKAYVDASPALSDVYVNGSWKTVLVFAQGDGGHNVTCLDVTDPLDPVLMWEFGNPALFESKSSPAIAPIAGSGGSVQWVAFFNSGKVVGNEHPAIFAVDIATGTLLNDSPIVLDSAGTDGLGSVPSGQPAAVDRDKNGMIDSLYVGSDAGFMYKVDISNTANIADSVLNSNERDPDQGIFASPAVVVDPPVNEDDDYKVRVFFGTGGESDTETYKFFAYVDTGDSATLDWSYELPAGHRGFASAFAAAGQVYFTTTTAVTEDPCEAGGQTEGNIYAFSETLADPDGEASPVIETPLPPGSGRVTPVVDDEHLYIKNTSGVIRSYGSGIYNNAAAAAPGTVVVEAMLQSWREVFEQ